MKRSDEVSLELGYQAFRPILVELEHSVAQLSGLAQSQIQASYAERGNRGLVFRFSYDLVPLPVSCLLIVLHCLFLIKIAA